MPYGFVHQAMWRIFKFGMNHIYPTVERLQIHLSNMHQARIQSNQTIANTLTNERVNKTMLNKFFTLNRNDAESRKYLYREILSIIDGFDLKDFGQK